MIGAEPHTFAKLVKGAPVEFFVLYAPFMSWRGASFRAVIRRKETGFLRRARFTYTLGGPGPEGITTSTEYDSRGELVDRMLFDNQVHNEGRPCWIEF